MKGLGKMVVVSLRPCARAQVGFNRSRERESMFVVYYFIVS